MTQPTEKMIEFAENIAKTLNIREPEYDNYEEVSAFIAKNKDDYYRRLYDNRDYNDFCKEIDEIINKYKQICR